VKTRRKHNSCLNCGHLLKPTDNYCPNCGQENTDHQVSLGLLMREFTSNFFSLDSRFAHTFKPFLFSPGKITNAFIDGRRVYYANPIRWYLVISIIHFFLLSKVLQPSVHDRKQLAFGDAEELSVAKFDSLYHLPDSAHQGWPLSGERQKMVEHLIETTDLTSEEIIDSLKIEKTSWGNDFLINKYVRINQETSASLNDYIMGQIPIIVFFILPIYAFLLKVFFWRKGLYIKHLIHSIHIHSFYFFLLSIVWIITLIFPNFQDAGLNLSLFIMAAYIVVSIKKVYGVRMRWGIVRLFFLGIFYMIFMAIAMLIGVVLSLAML